MCGKREITLKTIMQYLAIYILLVFNQSVILQQVSKNSYMMYIVLLVLIGIILLFKRCISKRIITYLFFLFVILVAVRMINGGGVGLDSLVFWMCLILVPYLVVQYNDNEFIRRYIRVVVFLSIISLFFFIWQIIDVDSLQSFFILKGELSQQYVSYTYEESLTHSSLMHYRYYGLLFYVLNGAHLTRNVGIFTEPGIYQMVLISAIFLLCFAPFKEGKKNKWIYFVILACTLITTQSTTGYISLVALVLIYIWKREGRNEKIRNSILLSGSIVLIGIITLYVLKGTDNVFHQVVVKKIAESFIYQDGRSSGGARVGVIKNCIKIMLDNPQGVGFDNVNCILQKNVVRYAGAGIMIYGAAMGIFCFVYTIVWSQKPVICSDILSKSEKALFVFIYLNVMFAQSLPFYPVLLVISFALEKLSKT